MVNFFKNSKATQARPGQSLVLDKKPTASKERRLVPRPLPVPEVVEGNADTDWSLWQESVAFQDSRVQPLWQATEPGQLPDAAPITETEAADPFASVHKNSS